MSDLILEPEYEVEDAHSTETPELSDYNAPHGENPELREGEEA